MARSRTAKQKAALRKAQLASARKRRRRGGRRRGQGLEYKPGGASKKGYAISALTLGLPGAVGYGIGATLRGRRNARHNRAVKRAKGRSRRRR